jgi:hypothetical protein
VIASSCHNHSKTCIGDSRAFSTHSVIKNKLAACCPSSVDMIPS